VLIGAGIATFVVVAIAIVVPSGRAALAGGADGPTVTSGTVDAVDSVERS